jgi:LmbE family N-acetylglucosaminyl deacetylase
MAYSKSALAAFAHPDDIEFCAAGTLLLLADQGWSIHYFNISSGDLGSFDHDRIATQEIRRNEGKKAAQILGATYHESICHDLQIFYNADNIRKVASVVRECQASIVLTHSPVDYMSDHEIASQLAVTATFSRGMPNFVSDPPVDAVANDVTVYHAMPHGMRDPLRKRIKAGLYIDTASTQDRKREALAAHKSQKEWLDRTQGMDSYLKEMDRFAEQVGQLSGKFRYAEGWRRRLHLGFSAKDEDLLQEALSDYAYLETDYESSLDDV